ncbi:MAG: phospholipase D-like domain-containing protein [bacterium]|nr:phospholipase D-like domain-containing protein [bacterium]
MPKPEQASTLTLGLDDRTGLRVVKARYLEEQKFDWGLFEGFESLRVLTYSASAGAIVKMLDDFSFKQFECVFGSEATLGNMVDVLAFQKVAAEGTRAAIMGLRDDRHQRILAKVTAGQATFRVLRNSVAHAKLFLLAARDRTRVIVGSANLSERAFGGQQPETLVVFDDDEGAWDHYCRMFDTIRDSGSDEIPLPEHRIVRTEIEVPQTPVLSDDSTTLVIEPTPPAEAEVSPPAQVERIEKVASVLRPRLSAALPPLRGGRQRITPKVKRELSRIRLVKSTDEATSRFLSIDRVNRTAVLSDEKFSLDWDSASVENDSRLVLRFFGNYEGAFEGDVPMLQRDYFTFMAWLYFSPLICDLRSLAYLRDSDVVRYPSFAIIFGKSNCGKTSLVDTLMASMFGRPHTVEKRSFTTARLRGLQHAYRRHPVVFDDIGRRAFNTHGKDLIKDEYPPQVTEYPGFVLSMNAEPHSFPDEIVKRSLTVYTTTALPAHDEQLRQRLQSRVRTIRGEMTGHLYRRYLVDVMARLEDDPLPEDWLAVSSSTLSGILAGAAGGSAPHWCREVEWLGYADKRYDRVRSRVLSLLREPAYARREGETPNGWTIEGDNIVVWEQRDAFGRRGFSWDDLPSTLIDEASSGGDRTVLHRAGLERFIGKRIRPRRRWWTLGL